MKNPSPIELTADLIRCPSVTPDEGGAITLLETLLKEAGFICTRIPRGGIENLYARWGQSGPVLGFNGHTDVVPIGSHEAWSQDPFGGHIENGILWGRGATDMKSGVAAFVASAIRFVQESPPDGSIAILITGDEEGDATDGTTAILDWMQGQGETLDACLVGEPTSVTRLGDVIKIGRRGSMTGRLTVRGKQGHTAYPERANNPLPILSQICAAIAGTPLDQGSEHFQPSTLALTSIDVGNPANNVIPASGTAIFNIRYNDLHDAEGVKAWVQRFIDEAIGSTGCSAELEWKISGESFLTQPGAFTEMVSAAVAGAAGTNPQMTTGGGTSDARFIKSICPVVEVGLVGDTMHQVDERVPVADVEGLSRIYGEILRRFFA
ncbi:MAG: succinyl-diaminopimelate desuccinylase [Pseudomonadota bacterium]